MPIDFSTVARAARAFPMATALRFMAWVSLGAIAGWIIFAKVDAGSTSSDLDGALIGGFMGFIVSRWFNR